MARTLPEALNWNPQRTRRNIQGLLTTAVLIAVLLVGLFVLDLARVQNRTAMLQIGRYQLGLSQVGALLRDMETAQRGFLLTGDDSFLDPYRRAQLDLPPLFAELRDLAPTVGADAPAQIEQLNSNADRWQTAATQSLAVRRASTGALDRQTDVLILGRTLFDALRSREQVAEEYARSRNLATDQRFVALYPWNLGMLALVTLSMLGALSYSIGLVRRIGEFAEALRVRQDRVQAYNRVITGLNGPTEMQPLLQNALPTMVQAVGGQIGVVYLLEEGLLQPAGVLGLDERRLAPLRSGEGLPGLALEQSRAVAASDLPPDQPFRIATGLGQDVIRSVVSVPLRFGSAALGVVTIGSVGVISEDDTQQLRLAASQLATAISNVRAFESADRQREELRQSNAAIVRQLEENQILQDMGRELAKQRDLQPLLNLVCREARRLLGADYAAVATQVDANGATRWVATDGMLTSAAQNTVFEPHTGTAGQVIDQAAPLVIENLTAEEADAYPVHAAEQMRAALGVPLFRKEVAIGALIIGYRRSQPISPEMISLSSALAAYASVAIENARLLSALSNERDLVRARARELEGKNQEVEHANRLKSEFVANMSHELRTPLNSILALSQILDDELDGPLNDEQRKQVGIIERNGQNLLRLINDILDLSKIEAGKLDLLPTNFQPRDLVENIRGTIEPLVMDKRLQLAINLAPGLPRLHTDENKLKQVLLNLLSNAVKFTERGTITIAVRAGREVGTPQPNTVASDWATFEVSDTGIGIAEADLPTVWEEFQQIDGSLSRRYEGTGLGLAIVRRLVELLGGEITATSVVGQGSTFTLSIPARLSHTAETMEISPTPALAAEQPAAERPSVERFRQASKPVVLIVDDDPEVIYILEKYLYDDGYEIEVARTGDEAITKARTLRPFAMTLDVMLPGRDGWDVIQTLKADPATSDIPIIMLSMLDNRQLGYSLGASDYLVKPVARHDLLARLQRLRNGHPIQQVLVVDDDPIEQRVLATALRDNGMAVETCASGADALAWLESHVPDVITLDLMMPGMDGFTVLEAIKARPDLKQVPVLIITAKEITAADRERLNSRIATVIQKGPRQRAELLAEVGDTLNRQWARQIKRLAEKEAPHE